jgi:ABC-type multidrug transport system, ATPase component
MLKVKDLNFGFGDNSLYENLNLSFDSNKVYGLLGQNGAGKTTLFRLLYGWYKPQSGSISFNGKPVDRQNITFLETDPYFYSYMTGREYLKLIKPEQSEKVESYASLFNLPLDNIVDSYSTGMRKKLAFLGGQLQGKPIQILDEPFNGVDLESNEILKKLIIKSGNESLVIMSSHILNTLLDTCDEVVYLSNPSVQVFKKGHFDELESIINDSIDNKFERLH